VTARVDCACGAVFDVPDELVGGWTNCARCGKAVEVAGLRDPAWRALQVGAAAVVLVGAGATCAAAGPLAGVLVGAALGLLAWLVSRPL
jgi:hypothetical protein